MYFLIVVVIINVETVSVALQSVTEMKNKDVYMIKSYEIPVTMSIGTAKISIRRRLIHRIDYTEMSRRDAIT